MRVSHASLAQVLKGFLFILNAEVNYAYATFAFFDPWQAVDLPAVKVAHRVRAVVGFHDFDREPVRVPVGEVWVMPLRLDEKALI